MVTVMCQLDWAIECPDTWSNIILSVSIKVFLGEITSVKLVKQIALPNVDGPHRLV